MSEHADGRCELINIIQRHMFVCPSFWKRVCSAIRWVAQAPFLPSPLVHHTSKSQFTVVAIARTKCAKWTSRRCTHAHMSLWSISLIPHRRPSSLQCSFLRYSRVQSPRSSLLSMQRAIRTSRRVRVGRSGSILASDKLQCGVPMLCAAPPPGDGGMAASFVRPRALFACVARNVTAVGSVAGKALAAPCRSTSLTPRWLSFPR